MSELSLHQARVVVHAALEKSKEIGIKMNIAVVDAGENLKKFTRMDGAWLGSIDIVVKKARTARFFDMNTCASQKVYPSQKRDTEHSLFIRI